jgi:hypothetical protein
MKVPTDLRQKGPSLGTPAAPYDEQTDTRGWGLWEVSLFAAVSIYPRRLLVGTVHDSDRQIRRAATLAGLAAL